MSTAANIVLADAASTPVNHTFTWSGVDRNGVSHWVDRVYSSQPIGYWTITMSQRDPVRRAQGPGDAANGVYRDVITLAIPVLEVVSNSTISGIAPAPTISHVERVRIEFISPERSTKETRQHARKMAMNLLANAQVLALVEDLDQPRQ